MPLKNKLINSGSFQPMVRGAVENEEDKDMKEKEKCSAPKFKGGGCIYFILLMGEIL